MMKLFRPNNEDGTSLAEMLVSIGIFALLGTALAATVIASQQSAQEDTNKIGNVQSGQTILDVTTKVLRTATTPDTGGTIAPWISGSPTSMSFYASLCTSITTVSIYIDAKNNVVEQTAPYSAPGQVQTRTLGGPVVAGSSPFAFYGATGNLLETNNILKTVDLKNVRLVRITLPLAPVAGHSTAATTVTTDVDLPNANYAPNTVTAGAC